MSTNDNKEVVRSAKVPSLVDICSNEDGNPCFLIQRGNDLSIENSINGENTVIKPPHMADMTWMLPSAKKVIEFYKSDDDKALFRDIQAAIYDNVELPDNDLYPFFSAWVLHTHIIDRFHHSPMIILYAVKERGKSRLGKVLTWIGRRGNLAETIREADIIRKSDRFQCLFFFDIYDAWSKAGRLGSQDVLLGRFDEGIKIARVTNPEKRGFGDTQHFSCYGATIIATNETVHSTLDSRGITVVMKEATRKFDNDPRPLDFLELKERCTAFRARTINREIPYISKPAIGRLGDIMRPIYQVMHLVNPEEMPSLNRLILSFDDDRKDALADSPEGRIVQTLIKCKKLVSAGKVATDDIAAVFNENMPENYRRSNVSVGKSLKALGFRTTKVENKRGIIYDEPLIDHLAEQYGYKHLIDAKLDNAGGTDGEGSSRKKHEESVVERIIRKREIEEGLNTRELTSLETTAEHFKTVFPNAGKVVK